MYGISVCHISSTRSTIESLRLTIATLQRTIESLHDGEKHYSKMTQDAMKYMKNGWKDLIRYRDDGNYDIDNLIAYPNFGIILLSR